MSNFLASVVQDCLSERVEIETECLSIGSTTRTFKAYLIQSLRFQGEKGKAQRGFVKFLIVVSGKAQPKDLYSFNAAVFHCGGGIFDSLAISIDSLP